MTIIEKIKQSVEGATGMPFLYHAAGELNELIARCKSLPVAYSFLIDSGTIDDVNGRYHERVTLAVMFCDKTEFDFNAIENEEIIDRMKVKAYKWLQSLRMSNALRVVSINNTQRLYDNTTDILTGFAVNITIDDLAGVGECELPDVIFEIKENGEYPVVGIDKVIVKVIASVSDCLTDLVATENNKEYLPSDYGACGFGSVTVEIPKVKVVRYPLIKDCCIDKNGKWTGEHMFDTSCCKGELCEFANNIKGNGNVSLDLSDWDTSGCTRMSLLFTGSRGLVSVNLKGWDTSNVTRTGRSFNDTNIKSLDLTSFDFSKVTSQVGLNSSFLYGAPLETCVDGLTVEQVINNDITIMKGLRVSIDNIPPTLDRASLRALINGLADLTGQTVQILTLGAKLLAKLTEEDIAIATNKNWTIA